jgi:hypothetical protein
LGVQRLLLAMASIEFKPNAAKDVVIAGAPAKPVTGSGNEADNKFTSPAKVGPRRCR